jgi:Uma2 family endonuclease
MFSAGDLQSQQRVAEQGSGVGLGRRCAGEQVPVPACCSSWLVLPRTSSRSSYGTSGMGNRTGLSRVSNVPRVEKMRRQGGTMSAVSIAEAWPARGRLFTVDDLDKLPDDGRRYELLDGVLVVSPRPTTIHQLAATRLATLLDNACPGDLCVLAEPTIQLTADTEFDPDVVVVRPDDVGGAKLTSPSLLVVEVRSPRTALIDLDRKKAAYQRFGVRSYWIMDPDPQHPSITVFGLRDGRYAQLIKVENSDVLRAEHPFPVEVIPARLLAGLPDQARN